MSLSPLERYQYKLTQSDFAYDPVQLHSVTQLELLYQALKAPSSQKALGLYLWGDVGRGKTMLMDLFCEAATDLLDQPPLRLHFHRFMARMHKEMMQESGNTDPLKRIAKRIASETKLICFDEFFVSDIGDAMILGTLFSTLFELDVVLVATSNIPITRLYENGLQRQRFEPTVRLLAQHTQEIHLNGEHDHRLRYLNYHQTYFLEPKSDFSTLFEQLSSDSVSSNQPLMILGRPIEVIKANQKQAWLDFDALCNGPRSQLDYIELASRFEVILLSDIPPLGGEPRGWIRARGTEDGCQATQTGERQLNYAVNDDPARRFISLVDELYDQGVALYLSASVALEELYIGGALSFEFKRTYSRLTEMQSLEYLSFKTL
ncbi:cell division protein ZapE [Shewanella nanhaiensis]|uniref:AFG1 family ATPase n=1 Tax=Shewanella nanhaiensis TaxID=2864872 RepID=A0ABS7E0L3_9GAMM|nr:cell division protein ZapE [Shewanella nanhaiensis]MBW8183154.1 AFG1 family ATPase [Shewanella nanhaiensis]